MVYIKRNLELKLLKVCKKQKKMRKIPKMTLFEGKSLSFFAINRSEIFKLDFKVDTIHCMSSGESSNRSSMASSGE